MKCIIVNYKFEYKSKTYWFTDEIEALVFAQQCIEAETNLKPDDDYLADKDTKVTKELHLQ